MTGFQISSLFSRIEDETLKGTASNLPDSPSFSFSSSLSAHSGTVFCGSSHWLVVCQSRHFLLFGKFLYEHNHLLLKKSFHIRGNFHVADMPGSLGLRNTAMNNITSGGTQQAAGNFSSGRFASNNLPVAFSQISHNNAHGHSGMSSKGGMGVAGNQGYSSTNGGGGSVPGILPSSAATGNRMAVPGFGVSPVLGNAGPHITSSVGNIAGGGNIGRTINTGGGLSMPGFSSRLNLSFNSSSGNLNVHGQSRLMGGMLQQASPQVLSMLSNSYPTAGGSLNHNHVQAVNNLGGMSMLNDVNSNDGAPFDVNDFPQLSSRPSSSGGPQGQLGSLRKQGLNPIAQQNQEFSIESEDFPALPGFKGGNGDYSIDMQPKDQLHDSSVSMMQPQHFSMAHSAGYNLGAIYSPFRQQQQHAQSANGSATYLNINNQDLLHLHGSEMFPSPHPTFHSQSSGHPGLGLRPSNFSSSVSGTGSYDQLLQQYQQYHNPSRFFLQQMSRVDQSYRDQGNKLMQSSLAAYDPFSLLGLLKVIRMSDPNLTALSLGMDLTTLGLNLNSAENLHKTFGSPWSDEPSKGDPEFTVPQCYYAKEPPPLSQAYFSKLQLDTLFYIFYSMPKDETQLYSANELYNRGWFYHKEHRLWFKRVTHMEPLIKTNSYERSSFICFDPNTWETIRKDNFVLDYEMLEKRPAMPQH